MSAYLLTALVIAHFIGDYGLQSDWMAAEKVKRWWPAVAHGLAYGLPFLLIDMSWGAWLVIVGTHAVLDRLKVAHYLVWLKNFLAPPSRWPGPWSAVKDSRGCVPSMPEYLRWAVGTAIDNTLHISINILAVMYL